ncbi:MAG: ECF-type sigma factor [Planctomycetota bacterium]|jgi:RNA polymerase sigma factor (TIGR02999 family)
MTDLTGEATRLLREAGAGSEQAAAELLPLVYKELRALAQSHLNHERNDHTLQATALVHEAYLRLIDGKGVQPRDRDHFFALAAQAIRRILVDHARARRRHKRGGNRTRIVLDDVLQTLQARPGFDLLLLDDALERLAEIDPQYARIVEMRFFGGSTMEEIATLLGVSLRTVERDWRVARAWLYRELSEEGQHDDEQGAPQRGSTI